MLRITGSDCGIEYLPLPVDDPARRRPDITRAIDLLNWKPEINAEDGIGRTVEWFREDPSELNSSERG